MTIQPPTDPAFEPYRDGAAEESYPVELFGSDPPSRLYHRYWFDDGQTVDAVLTHEVQQDDDVWAEVVRMDCKDGEVHIHWFGPSGKELTRKSIKPIQTQQDMLDGIEHAEKLIYDGWERNLGRWARGK